MSIKKVRMPTILVKSQQILNEKNFNLFAAQHYINPRLLDPEEFIEDLIRFKYLKRLFSRYKERGELQERLILNHLTIIHNVFSLDAATEMCFFKIDQSLWPALKTFLLYLNFISPDNGCSIPCDLYVIKQLQRL